MLEAEHLRSANWSSARITAVARHLGLNRTKVYKWSWDRKKKDSSSTVVLTRMDWKPATSLPTLSDMSNLVKEKKSLQSVRLLVQPTAAIYDLKYLLIYIVHENKLKQALALNHRNDWKLWNCSLYIRPSFHFLMQNIFYIFVWSN